VEGIRRVLEREGCPEDEEISVLFVGHDTKHAEKTRRLFTTLNKRARRIGEANRIALDEDDGFAVIARRLVDDAPVIPEELIKLTASAAIQDREPYFTHIITLYNTARDLFPGSTSLTDRAKFCDSRPSDADLGIFFDEVVQFWKVLRENAPEVDDVITARTGASALRAPKRNHLLLRPIGQRGFAGAVRLLVTRDKLSLVEAVSRLCQVDMWIHKRSWAHVAWDPIQAKMKNSVTLIESALLKMVGAEARTQHAGEKLEEVFRAR
jgi:DNA sulfur modification protein DndB